MVRLVLVADCQILIVNLNNLENCGVGYVKTCVGNACTCVGYSQCVGYDQTGFEDDKTYFNHALTCVPDMIRLILNRVRLMWVTVRLFLYMTSLLLDMIRQGF